MRCVRPSLLAMSALLLLAACDDLPDWLQSETDKAPTLPGERIAILKQETDLKVDESLSATPMEIPAAMTRSDWPAHHGDPSGFGDHPVLSEQISLQQTMSVGDGEAFENKEAITPVVAGGVVFGMDAVGAISAHRASDANQLLWKNAGVANAEEDVMLAGGLAFGESKLFAVSGNGLLAAFDPASGRELWRQAINIPVRAAPTVAAGRVYVVTIDSQMHAFDAATGTNVWLDRGINEGASFIASASASYSNGLLAVPYASSELRVLTADEGAQIWSDTLATSKRNVAAGEFSGMGGDPVIVGNALYAVSASGIFGAYRLDNGLRIWEQPISSVNTPWVVGNVVYVLSTEAQLIALNRIDGRVYWITTLPKYKNEKDQLDAYTWSGPVLAGGKLYVVGAHGELKSFNPTTGALVDTLDVPDDIVTSPVIAGDKMYLAAQNAKIYVLY
jgi:outer membrane protein assembly factor BamB